ncbi:MAG: agmatine deiminase family protein [Acidobacteriales bacterium]|nr:agmatine deiminase family protein [Terriglobales bacterium]
MEALPRELGFVMPGEWEPHAATWIAWPHNPTDWPGKFPPIPWVYADIVRHLALAERVHILVNDAAHRAKAQKVLNAAMVESRNIDFHLWPTDRVWTRDSGATFVRNAEGKVGAIDWKFNAWAKYPDWKRDDKIAGKMASSEGVPCRQPVTEVGGKSVRVVLEGGSIDANGKGTLLTTRECLLSELQQRNPGVSKTQYEKVFADYLGIKKVIWLNRGTAGDDTHGHVDDISRFVAANTVLTAVEPNRLDENHEPLQENLEILRTATDQDGNRLKVMTLPMPAPFVFQGQRLPASYANFYIANGLVLAPTFNDPNDRVALHTLAECFPERKIVGIHCGDLIWGLGAIHCMTQQQPAASGQ